MRRGCPGSRNAIAKSTLFAGPEDTTWQPPVAAAPPLAGARVLRVTTGSDNPGLRAALALRWFLSSCVSGLVLTRGHGLLGGASALRSRAPEPHVVNYAGGCRSSFRVPRACPTPTASSAGSWPESYPRVLSTPTTRWFRSSTSRRRRAVTRSSFHVLTAATSGRSTTTSWWRLASSRAVLRALRDVLAAPGMWLHHVSGEAAGQDVFHYHLHLIPRYDDDAVQPGWGAPPWRPPDVRAADLDSMPMPWRRQRRSR
jgi:hypothetical protein